MRWLVLLSLVLASTQLGGCAVWTELARDPRDAAWDPKPGQRLFDQLPAWDNMAQKVCAGHLPPNQRRLGQVGGC